MDDVLKSDKDRLKLFKKYGYDIPMARKFIISKARLVKGGNMLEVGTGRGHMATALAQKGFKFILSIWIKRPRMSPKYILSLSGATNR